MSRRAVRARRDAGRLRTDPARLHRAARRDGRLERRARLGPGDPAQAAVNATPRLPRRYLEEAFRVPVSLRSGGLEHVTLLERLNERFKRREA